jgi:hypothetical protein
MTLITLLVSGWISKFSTKSTRLLTTAIVAFSLLIYSPSLFGQAANLDQVRNGAADGRIDPGNWVNGNLGAQTSHYAEGMSIPYRVIMTNMPAGEVVELTLGFDVKHSGKHALDYLTSYDRIKPHDLAFGHDQEVIDPTIDVSGVSGNGSPYTIPPPPGTTSLVAGQPVNSYNMVNGAGDAEMTIWNATITNIQYETEGNLSLANSSQNITVYFTVAGNVGDAAKTVLLSWGAHIANRLDWDYGDGKIYSAGGINGSPYHMRLVDWNLGNLGNQDRSLQAKAVVPPPRCELAGIGEVCEGSENDYTLTPIGAENPSYYWELLNNTSGASFVGDPNSSSTTTIATVNSGTSGGSYTVRVTISSEFGTNICEKTTTVNPSPDAPITGGDANCDAGIVNLTASGCEDGLLTWYDSEDGDNVVNTGTTYDPNLNETTHYWVSCTLNDCEGPRQKVTGTIYPSVNAGEDGSDRFCEGDNTKNAVNLNSLIAGEDINGVWADTDGTGVILGDGSSVDLTGVSPGGYTFTYTVTPSDQNSVCPADSSEVEITIDAEVNAGEDGSAQFCEEDSALTTVSLEGLLSGADTGGVWSDPGTTGVDLSDPSSVDLSGLGDGEYTFVYTVQPGDVDSTCPNDSADIMITIDEALNAGGDGSDRFCEGDDTKDAVDLFALLTGDPDAGGSWEDTDNSGVSLNGGNAVDFTSLANGSYTFTYRVSAAQGSECLEDTSEVEITVDAKVDAGDDGGAQYCEDDSSLNAVNLTALLSEADGGGDWIDTDGTNVDLSNPSSVDLSNLGEGSYIFTYKVTPDVNSTCPTDSADIVINIDDALNAGVDGNDRFCEGDDSKNAVDLFALLTGNPDVGGAWEDTDNSGVSLDDGSAVDFTSLANGSYTFTYRVSPAQGSECLEDTSEIEITVDAKVDAGDDGGAQYCEDDSSLNAVNLTALLSGADGGGDWIDADGTNVDLSDPSAVDLSGLGEGSYIFTYKVTPDVNSTCPTDSANMVIKIDDALDAGGNGMDRFCEGDNSKNAVDLFALLTGDPDTGGTWADTDNSGVNLGDGSAVNFTSLADGSYTFTYTVLPAQGSECLEDSSIVEITVDPKPVAPEIETTLADCLGGDGGVIFKDAPDNLYYSLNGVDFILYSGPIPLAVGTHDLYVKYGVDGCVSDAFQVEVERPQAGIFDLVAEITQPDCETFLGGIKIRVGINPDIDTGFFKYTVRDANNVVYYDNELQPAGGFINLPAGNYVITGISTNGCDSGNTQETLDEPICITDEGCTLGYWKNHTDRWNDDGACGGFYTSIPYGSVFVEAPVQVAGKTLLEALNAKGGGMFNLARQSVAALLNTCHNDVAYVISNVDDLIALVNEAYATGDRQIIGSLATQLDAFNNAGCPLGGSSATTGDNTPTLKVGGVINDFSVYPVPFKETLNIQYDINYESAALIQIFDVQGRLLRTFNEHKAYKGKVTELGIDFRTRASQVYILKVSTDREVFSKNIISDK